MNILAVGANPDDIEFLCTGTLALYSKMGHNVSIAQAFLYPMPILAHGRRF